MEYTFHKITRSDIKELHLKTGLKVGDILINRKNERFTVIKIESVYIDLVGSQKGRIFTVYLNR
jgi:hypothetical protein